jgi:hypothetical protein
VHHFSFIHWFNLPDFPGSVKGKMA